MSLIEGIFSKLGLLKGFKESFLLTESTNKLTEDLGERFYPATVPPFKNEPTRDQFAIVQHKGSGEGVISKVAFKKGDLVFRFWGTPLDFQTLYTLQQEKGVYIEDPFFMGKILHSCNPNTKVNIETQEFRAIKDIAPGDWITMDYESTEDRLYRSFQCSCGSSRCRGTISGRLARVKKKHVNRRKSPKN